MADMVDPLITPEFRACYAWLMKPKPDKRNPDKAPKYTVLMLFPPQTDLGPLRAAFVEAAKAKWAEKAQATVKLPNFKSPFKSADSIVDDEGNMRLEWAAGWTAIEAWTYGKQGAPGIAGPRRDPVTGKAEILTDERDVYSGMWARAKVRPYAYDMRKDGASFGVSFDLINLQKLRDDERLGRGDRTKPEDDFEPIAPPDDGAGGASADSFF